MELHYCLPFPDRRFLQHNKPRVRNTTLHNNTDRSTYIKMALSTSRVVSVVISEIILYFTAYDVLCFVIVNEWVSDDYSSLVSISAAMSRREQLTLDKIIIMYAFFQTIALKVRHVAPLGHIIPTLNQPICLCP